MALTKPDTSVRQQDTPVSTKRSAGFPLASLLLGGLALGGMLITIWMAFLYAPTDAVEGPPQRIFYLHVPVAWVGMLSFIILTICGVVYLWQRDERWDWAARASAEIGAVFLSLALITGSIWGKTTWGTWWTWDPQLTTTLILWFMFIAYLMLRSYMGRTAASARSGAVLAIIGVMDVPIIYDSAVWWRTLPPPKEIGVAGALPSEVVLTLMVALVSFTLLYSFLMIQVYQLQRAQTLAERLRALVE